MTRLAQCPFACIVATVMAFITAAKVEAALSYTIGGSWDSDARRNAAAAAMQQVVNRYNAYGNFGNYNIWVYYNAGIPTAQASYQGSIGFGGTWPAERVTQHEIAHYLGLPSNGWGTLMSGGSWSGPRASALVKQFDGEQATLNGDSIHFWPYGLNYDNEGSEFNKQRQVALVYAMRADLGIGPGAHPSLATIVTLTGDDAVGASSFNYKDRWSDGYFAHAGADYFTADHAIRTPASGNSFTFYGDSLTLNNTTFDHGLNYKGTGAAGVITIDDLRLDGGSIHHLSNIGDVFQLDGNLTVASDSSIRAKQGNINVLADVHGAGALTIHETDLPTENNRWVRFRSSNNTFTGDIVNQARFELSPGANLRFAIGPSGTNNVITGATARNTLINGTFELDLASATAGPADSWTLVNAANAAYGASFQVAGFDKVAAAWSNGDYLFTPASGTLTVVPAWNIDGGGLWSHGANWTSGVAPAGIDAKLGGALTAPNAPAELTLDVPATLNRLTFDNANRYVIRGGNALTLTGAAQFKAASGVHEIAVPVAGTNGLTVKGPGTIVLSAANLYSGDTNVDSGTLAIVEGGSLANSTTIRVHADGTLDASQRSTAFHLASGQTLYKDNGGAVQGVVVAGNGSSVIASGAFAGNLTAQAGSVIQIGGAGLPAAPGPDKIDDFESYAPGKLNAGATGGVWTGVFDGTANAQVVAAARNQSLEYYGTGGSWRGARTSLTSSFGRNDYGLADGDAATYFFRVQRQGTQTIDGIFGLTDQDSIGVDAPWQELAVTLSLFQDTAAGSTTALRAYDGDGAGDIVVRGAVAAGEWINVWLVVDNESKTYQIATSTAGADGTLFPRTFNFGRQSALGAALDTFAGAEYRSSSNPANASVRLDDLYRLAGADLRNPLNIPTLLYGESLLIEGDLQLEAGATVTFDAYNAARVDHLDVQGELLAGGALRLLFDATAPAPQLGDVFDLLDFASASGAFDAFDLPALAAGLAWNVSSLTTRGELAVTLDVDLNDNGWVDGADFLAIQRSDSSLISAWTAQFGQRLFTPPLAAAVPTPEPSSPALLLLAAASTLRYRK